jgi:thiosulfate dehydrogenase
MVAKMKIVVPKFLAVLVLTLPTVVRAQELWTVRGGQTTLALNSDALSRAGLGIMLAGGDRPLQPAATVSLEMTPDSTLTFTVRDGAFEQLLGGKLFHSAGFVVRRPKGDHEVRPISMGQTLGPAFEPRWMMEDWGGSVLIMGREKTGFDPVSRTLTIHSPDLAISPAFAESLGDAKLANLVIGTLTIRAQAEWVGGDSPGLPQLDSGAARAAVGPDMTFCQLYQLSQYGRLGDIVGLAVGTTSWNVGTRDLMWFPSPESQHPFIVMNLYRLKNDRFEQIGQSAVKHGFYALGSIQCGATCTYEPGHSQGRWLGVGCTDTYSSPLNAAQGGMAPRSEVNPWTGSWTYAGSHLSQGHSHNAIQHRLQVHDADLNPPQNSGATYYCEGYYAITDDVDVMNSAAWKPATVSGSPGGTWSFGMSGAYTLPTSGFAIDAWTGTAKVTLAQVVPPIEFVSPDGRCVLAAKTTDLGGGVWHYEYALLNIDMHRKVKSFSVPVAPWVMVTNIGFHAVESHDEPFSNTAWSSTLSAGAIAWSTVDNPLRWGALYNFRFDAQAAPISNTPVELGLYEPGTPTTVSGLTLGPDTTLSGDALRGGLLWDKWWTVNGAPAPVGNHPLYPPIGQQSGATTYRCKECHGWDYKGAAGAYGSGPHYTGIRGVYGTTKTDAEMFELIKMSAVPNGHRFSNYGLSDQDILDLMQFIRDDVIDTGLYIDGAGQFLGDEVQGQINYTTGGWISCNACHGDNGADINFGTPQSPEWIGTMAVYNPWELLHKTRFGQPGMPAMPSWLDWGGTNQGATDLGRYCQLNFPVDCLTNAHCAQGDPCNYLKMCQNGRCVASTLDGDLNGDGAANGADIQHFTNAVMAGSTDPKNCERADFSGNALMDADDIPCMATMLVSQ